MKALTLAVASLVWGLVCTGCGGGAAIVNGKVLAGNISFIGVVDGSDERLKGDGLAGVHVDVHTQPERAGPRVGDATSGPKGDFRIAVNDSNSLLFPAEFTAEKNGYLRTSTVMSIPPGAKRVLIILKSSGAGGGR